MKRRQGRPFLSWAKEINTHAVKINADIMIPMAIPAFGGMVVAAITYFITPVLYSLRAETKLKHKKA